MLPVGLEGTPFGKQAFQPRAGAQGSFSSSACSHTPRLTFLPLGCELLRDKCTIQVPVLAQSRITPKCSNTRLPAFTEGLCAAALCHLQLLIQCLTHSKSLSKYSIKTTTINNSNKTHFLLLESALLCGD